MKQISIITINYNNASGLEKTIRSVVEQTYNEYEYIIIDGASSDKSKEVVQGYQQYIDFWCSEKDSGIYNAMNKGIQRASGEYLLFLNSGDILSDSAVLSDIHSFCRERILFMGIYFYGGKWRGSCFCLSRCFDCWLFLERSLGTLLRLLKENCFKVIFIQRV